MYELLAFLKHRVSMVTRHTHENEELRKQRAKESKKTAEPKNRRAEEPKNRRAEEPNANVSDLRFYVVARIFRLSREHRTRYFAVVGARHHVKKARKVGLVRDLSCRSWTCWSNVQGQTFDIHEHIHADRYQPESPGRQIRSRGSRKGETGTKTFGITVAGHAE